MQLRKQLGTIFEFVVLQRDLVCDVVANCRGHVWVCKRLLLHNHEEEPYRRDCKPQRGWKDYEEINMREPRPGVLLYLNKIWASWTKIPTYPNTSQPVVGMLPSPEVWQASPSYFQPHLRISKEPLLYFQQWRPHEMFLVFHLWDLVSVAKKRREKLLASHTAPALKTSLCMVGSIFSRISGAV